MIIAWKISPQDNHIFLSEQFYLLFTIYFVWNTWDMKWKLLFMFFLIVYTIYSNNTSAFFICLFFSIFHFLLTSPASMDNPRSIWRLNFVDHQLHDGQTLWMGKVEGENSFSFMCLSDISNYCSMNFNKIYFPYLCVIPLSGTCQDHPATTMLFR